jgi:TIGR03009 family protein
MFVRIARRSTRAFTSATHYICFIAIAGATTIASAQVQPQAAQPNGQRQPMNAQPQPVNQPQVGLRQPSGIVQASGTDQPGAPVQQAAPQIQQPVGQMQPQPNGQAQPNGNVPVLRAGGVPLNVVPQNGNQQAGPPQVGMPQQQPGAAQQPGAQSRLQTLPNGAPLQPQVLNAAPLWQLTPQEEGDLNRLLTDWEKQSDKVKNFECKFTRWEYDPALAVNGNVNVPSAVSTGTIRYEPPDKGLFRVDESSVPDPKTGKLVPSALDLREHWTCDGNSIFMVDHQKKLVIESPLPENMKGKAITNGPLPFVFGAKAEALKNRYYMRLTTPKEAANEQVWLEARPKFQKDAANYSRVELILTKATLQPAAIQIYNPGAARGSESRTVIQFSSLSVNAFNILGWIDDFSKPKLYGYKHVLKDDAATVATAAAPPGAQPAIAPMANGAKLQPQPPTQAQKPTNPQR